MKKKIKTLYLHIGGMKTGSTTIQETLYNQRNEFLEKGIYYPEIIPIEHCATFPLVCMKEPKKFAPIVMYYSHLSEDGLKDYIDNVKQSWINEFEKCNVDKFVISDELLSMRLRYNELDLVVLKELLYTYFEEVKVICYVRDTSSLFRSVVQQMVKGGDFKIDINNLDNRIDPLRYKDFIPKYNELFGIENLIIRKFDTKYFYKNNLIKDFLSVLDPSENFDFVIDRRSNESLGNNAIGFLNAYAEIYPRVLNGKRNPQRATDIIDINLFSSLTDEKFSPCINFTKEEAVVLNESFECINQFLDDEYKLGFIEGTDEPSTMIEKDDVSVEFLREMAVSYFKKYNKSVFFTNNKFLFYKYYNNINNESKIEFFIELVNDVENQIIIDRKFGRELENNIKNGLNNEISYVLSGELQDRVSLLMKSYIDGLVDEKLRVKYELELELKQELELERNIKQNLEQQLESERNLKQELEQECFKLSQRYDVTTDKNVLRRVMYFIIFDFKNFNKKVKNKLRIGRK